MRSTRRASILIIADQTAESPQLLDAVARRAIEGPCSFTLLVPRRVHDLHLAVDLEDHGADQAIARPDAECLCSRKQPDTLIISNGLIVEWVGAPDDPGDPGPQTTRPAARHAAGAASRASRLLANSLRMTPVDGNSPA